MTITRNIIRMMDGNIQVQSTLGHGSCFTVTIHLKLQDRSKETPQELSGLPVLIVDDDQITCESTCIMLEDIGMQAEWCLNGKTAIQMVKEHHANDDDYFVAIIDWKMPEMDGIATARAIRKEVGPNVPIIIISAYDWSEIEADAQAAGVDRFISKPLFKSRLICCFKEFLHFDDRQYAPNAISIDEMCFSDKHLLLVEDNDLNAEIAKEILEMTGAKIHWATDGREAVSIIETSPEGYFDMIFMDIQMPLLNGYEATTTIRSLDRKDVKEIPIIAMTANAFLEDVNQAKRVGMNEHISKPIDMKQLENIMRKYLQ